MQPLKGAAETETQVVDWELILLSLSVSWILKLSGPGGCGRGGGTRLPLLLAEKIVHGILKSLSFESHVMLGECE